MYGFSHIFNSFPEKPNFNIFLRWPVLLELETGSDQGKLVILAGLLVSSSQGALYFPCFFRWFFTQFCQWKYGFLAILTVFLKNQTFNIFSKSMSGRYFERGGFGISRPVLLLGQWGESVCSPAFFCDFSHNFAIKHMDFSPGFQN